LSGVAFERKLEGMKKPPKKKKRTRRYNECMKCGKVAWKPDATWMVSNEEWASLGFKPTDVYCAECYREMKPNAPKPTRVVTIDDDEFDEAEAALDSST
jgi:hypothetical protein